ncbi:hypothetical protein BH10PSE13_BH10PSE13_13100 [soil metagenome]
MDKSAKRFAFLMPLTLAACDTGHSAQVVVGPLNQQEEIEKLQGEVADLQKQVADLNEKDKLLVTMMPTAPKSDPVLNIIDEARDRERDRRLEEMERRTGGL